MKTEPVGDIDEFGFERHVPKINEPVLLPKAEESQEERLSINKEIEKLLFDEHDVDEIIRKLNASFTLIRKP